MKANCELVIFYLYLMFHAYGLDVTEFFLKKIHFWIELNKALLIPKG